MSDSAETPSASQAPDDPSGNDDDSPPSKDDSPPSNDEAASPPSSDDDNGSDPSEYSPPPPPSPTSSDTYPPPESEQPLQPDSPSPPPPLNSSPPPSSSNSYPPPAISTGAPPAGGDVSQIPPSSQGSAVFVSPPPPQASNSTIAHSTSVSPTDRLNPPSNISRSDSPTKGNDNSTKAVVGGLVAGIALIMITALVFVVRKRRKRAKAYPPQYTKPDKFPSKADGFYYIQQQHSVGFSGPMNHSYGSQPSFAPMGGGPDSGVLSGSKNFFTFEQVMEMTSGFAHRNIIGEGGFGCVFKGWTADGKVVAVKQLKAGSGQGDREFKAEVEIISRVHHKHLVSLVGYSIAENQRMLIYEFVPNKTLEHHLHGTGLPVLDWAKRLKIAIGSAKGLAYLHEDCHPKIIHRDIKSANILLDDAFEAQVADFGLARLNDTTQTHVSTRVMGTFGYLAPEYASSGKLTDRSDVFSFGVVLLELITGRKPVDATQPLGDESLVEWARPCLNHALETGDLGELVDLRLEKHYIESEIFRMTEVAAACVRHSAPKRPRMMQVVRALDSEGEMGDLSNGVRFGQSTVYDSGQYSQDIVNFRRMALGSMDSSEFNSNSGECTSRNIPQGASVSSSLSSSQALNGPGPT